MRCIQWIFICGLLACCAPAFSFEFDGSRYAVYETGALQEGCRWVYVVPRTSMFILPGDLPVPLETAPETAGFRGTLCPNGEWSQWRSENFTTQDMAHLPYVATPSSIKLLAGDFDEDGSPDFLLQSNDTVRQAVMLTVDAAGVPTVHRRLSAASVAARNPRPEVARRSGRAALVATDNSGSSGSGSTPVIPSAASNGAAVRAVDAAGSVASDAAVAAGAVAVASAIDIGALNVDLAGSIEGRFSVDTSGAATYDVDILSAPGTAGLAPHIGLHYSSSDGDGVAGPGWSIGGLSSITRCRQTIAQDNKVTAIGFNADDRFCLDGQRLILTSGIYGGNGSTYRTEIDSYAVITAYAYFTGHPIYFTVQRKDGSLSYYGDVPAQGSNNSAPPVNGGAALTWAISRLQDSVGNTIRFQYSGNGTTSDHLVSRIDYGFGSDRGIAANSSTYIQFEYESRPDASSSYVGGSRIARTQRLVSIRSFSSGAELRSYHLSYRAPDGMHAQSFVEKLYECVGNSCVSPTVFNWQLNRGGFDSGTVVATVVGAKLSTIRALDINGDGRTDVVYRSLTAPYPLLYRLSNGAGFGAERTLLAATVKSVNVDDASVAVFDMNNDGRQDLLYVAPGTGTYPATFFAGGIDGFAAGVALDINMALPVAADIDGDGLPDLTGYNFVPFYRPAQRVNANGVWTTTFGAAQAFLGISSDTPRPPAGCSLAPAVWFAPAGLLSDGTDFNGDGRVDLPALVNYGGSGGCSISHAGVAISGGGGNFSTRAWSVGVPLPPADMNGDGLTDQWYKDAAGNRMLRFSTGADFTAPLLVGNSALYDRSIYVDFNGDGFSDLLWPTLYGVWVVQLFNPAAQGYDAVIGTTLPYQFAAGILGADQTLPLDIDADGHADLLRINHNIVGSTFTLYRSADAGGVGNRIVGIDNGLGNSTQITYKPLTDTSVYTKGTDANNAQSWSGPPVFDVLAPHYVVSRVRFTAPTAHAVVAGAVNYAAKRTTDYQYGGLKVQSGGRGSLGFSWIKTIDGQTGVASTTWYRQVFPLQGQPVWKLVVSSANRPVKSIVYTLGQIARNGIDGSRYYQAYNSVEEDLTLDPASGAELAYRVTQNDAPDEWGNVPRTVVSTYPAGAHSTYLTQTITSSSYGGTAYARRFGRLSSAVVTYRRAGEQDITRTSTFTYYPAGNSLEGLLWTENIATADQAPATTTSYRYDVFGNRTRTTWSASGEASRYADTTFDATGRFVASRSGEFYDGAGWSPRVTESIVARNHRGQPTELHHLNGLVEQFRYDVLGREISRSDNTGAALQTQYLRGGMTGAQYQVKTIAATGAATAEYFDALGRSIAQARLGFDGRWIHRDTEYDSLGRIKRHSEPHFSGETAYWQTNAYDAFRLLKRSEPATGGVDATTSITYDGLTTTMTNALGQTRVETRNAAGELTSATDHLGGVVTYLYDAAGQVRKAINNGVQKGRSISIETVLTYDQLGRKIKMVDSDKGTSFYQYNGFGELTGQYRAMVPGGYGGSLSMALGASVPMQRTKMVYDRRGRLVERSDFREGDIREATTRWEYDTQDNGVGQLAQAFIDGQRTGYSYGYDNYGRPAARLIASGGYYVVETTFDAYGRVATQTDALGSGSGTRNRYNATGYLESIEDMATGAELYRALEGDARGNVVAASTGDGAAATWSYDAGSGLLLDQATVRGKNVLQKLTYAWDALGNQTSRWDRGQLIPGGSKNLQNSYCYDGLNRLLKTHHGTLSGSCALAAAQQDQEYDSFGSITRKADVGTYTYYPDRPHQLRSSGDGVGYTYDAAGNMTADNQRVLTYTVFDKPSSIARSANRTSFDYGVDREVTKRVDIHDNQTTTTYRIGGVEKVVKPDGSYDMRRHIAGVAIWVHRFNSAGVQTGIDKRYVHRDALGSVVLLADEGGVARQVLGYDAWGQRVWPNNGSLKLPSTTFLPVSSQATTAGFAGHDMVDASGIVHMGGRIYDQRLGRFLQADPFVQAPGHLQSFNRYAYAFNAPSRFTDPSGFNGAGDDASTLGSSLGSGVGSGMAGSAETLLSTVFVNGSYGSGYSNNYSSNYSNNFSSYDGINGSGLHAGLIQFDFNNAALATPKALSVFTTVGGKSNREPDTMQRSLRASGHRKSAELGDSFLPGAAQNDTRMDCSSGVCYVTAPRQIYVTGHRIRGFGPFHTALEYDNGSGVEWISAGFQGYTLEGMNKLVVGVGTLVNGVRPTDAPSRNTALGKVVPPRGLTTNEYFQQLKEVTARYSNGADYDLFPGVADGYNSNSYLRGLLDVTGGTSTVNFDNFVGGEKALPSSYFSRE